MSDNLHTGFYETTNGLTIDKSPDAKLIYTFDWSEWLDDTDSISAINYAITTRTNDPTPLIKVSEGINDKLTYVELSAGALNKTYTVTAKITTANALIDDRSFRVHVINRSA